MNPGDLTTLANANQWLGLSGLTIAGISQAPAGIITLAAAPQTPLFTGLTVGIYGVNGPTSLNGNEYPITVIDATHFSIPVNTFVLPAWTGGGYVSVSDSLMQRLVSAVSTYIQSWLNRTIRNLPYVETRSGQGGNTLMLTNYPVTSVDSVIVDGITVPPRPALGGGASIIFNQMGTTMPWGPSGYTFDANRVMLSGLYRFTRAFSNCEISYAAGFLVSNERQTIPSVAPYTLTTLAHWNAGDRGVAYASSGIALNSVSGTPSVGQYSVDANGVYTFAAVDAGVAVLISYGYVPFDVEQAAVEMIGDWFKYQSRIGILSWSIEQQTTTFTNAAITARAQGVLNQYRRVFPVAA